MEPSQNLADSQPTGSGNLNIQEVAMVENEDPGTYSYDGAMQQDGHGCTEADMLDAAEQYGSDDQLNQAPYYSNRNKLALDPRLANLLDDDMANIDLQNGSDDPSRGQAYAGDVSSEDQTPVKPKRGLTKRSKNRQKKQADDDDEEAELVLSSDADEPANEDEDRDNDFLPEPVVPNKTKCKTVTPKATKGKGRAPTKTPTKPRKTPRKSASKVKDGLPFHRQRRAPKNGISESRPIARSYEECDEADKALIDMRDKENKHWKDIRVVWEEMTGQKTGNSTIPNRYERLKDNFSVIREEDRPLLLAAKANVEKEMAEKKWALIASIVNQNGGYSYSADCLQRQYKKMMLKEGVQPPPGVVDPDYSITVSEDDEDVGDDDG